MTSIRIDGVPHEFRTIEGVKEDVAEIILNIKQISIARPLANCIYNVYTNRSVSQAAGGNSEM